MRYKINNLLYTETITLTRIVRWVCLFGLFHVDKQISEGSKYIQNTA